MLNYELCTRHIVSIIRNSHPDNDINKNWTEVEIVDENTCSIGNNYKLKNLSNQEIYKDYNISTITKAACKHDSIDIVKFLLSEDILNIKTISEKNWQLVRVSKGQTLKLFLDIISTSRHKPDLNLFNIMFIRFCQNLDLQSILSLKEYGYLHNDLLRKPLISDERYMERLVIEFDPDKYDVFQCRQKIDYDNFCQSTTITDIVCSPGDISLKELDLKDTSENCPTVSFIKKLKTVLNI
jgi:hypothetical protein